MDGGGRWVLQSRAQGAESLGRKEACWDEADLNGASRKANLRQCCPGLPGFNVECTPIN